MIKIIVLIIILYICIRSCYLFYKKNYEEQESRILQLEQRVETYKLELQGRINALKIGIPDKVDINKLEKKVKNK